MKNKVRNFWRQKHQGIIYLCIGAIVLAVSSGSSWAANAAQGVTQIVEKPYGEYLAGLHAAQQNDLKVAADYHEQALLLEPENQMILRKSFTLFLADGRYDAALKAAHKLTELDISDSMVQMFLFLEHLKADDKEAALSNLESMGTTGVYALFKPLFQTWVLLAQGKEVEAEDTLIKLLGDKSFQNFKKFHAGLFYDYLGKTQLAEKMYSEALIVPDSMSLRVIEAYGILLRRLGRDTDARQLYKNYLEKSPGNSTLQMALSDLDKGARANPFITSEKEGVAEIFYSAANFLMQDNIRMPAAAYLRLAQYIKPNFTVANYLLAQIFESNTYFSGALSSYQTVPKDHPLYFNARLQTAWVLEKMGKLDEAIAEMERLSATFPEKPEVLGSLGDINRMHSRFEDAGVAYTKYIASLQEYKEQHWSIFYTRGIVYEQSQKWELAEADFLKALELRPDQPQVLNYLAYSWVDKGINVEKARGMLERAVELRPYDGYIIDSLGWALYRIGDTQKAVEYLEKAVLLQTDDWAINDHLGDAYWAVGRKYEARFQWRHALSLKPNDDLVVKIKNKIKDGKQ